MEGVGAVCYDVSGGRGEESMSSCRGGCVEEDVGVVCGGGCGSGVWWRACSSGGYVGEGV